MFGYSPLGDTVLGSAGAPESILPPDPGPDPEPEPKPSGRDYTWLKSSVISWSHRKDLASQIQDFVMMAEERMSADLEARGTESVSTITTAANTVSVSLPVGVIEIQSVKLPGYAPLGYLPPDSFNSWYCDQSGTPRHYTVIGDSLHLGPKPDAVYSLAVEARKTLAPLSDESPSNWLMKRNPGLYLAATMVEVSLFIRDPEGQSIWNGKYQAALDAANSTKGTAGPLVVRSDNHPR